MVPCVTAFLSACRLDETQLLSRYASMLVMKTVVESLGACHIEEVRNENTSHRQPPGFRRRQSGAGSM